MLVSEGVGIAIIDPTAAWEFEGRGVVTRPFSVYIDASFLVIRPPNQGASAIVDSFVQEFCEFHDREVPERRD